jgi:DNA gyrase subunit A
VNVLAVDAGERITAAVAVPNFADANYLTMATVKGRVKRVALSEFSSVRPSGLIAMTLEQGDELGWVKLTSGKDDILMVTKKGQALRISEDEIRSMGRQAAGVTGIKFKADDRLADMEVCEPNSTLLIVTEHGFGKRTKLDEYPKKGRATGGVITIDQKHLDKTGRIVAARVVQEDDEISLISACGIMLRLKVKTISISGRSTRGFRVMDLDEGDAVASVARNNSSPANGTESEASPAESPDSTANPSD